MAAPGPRPEDSASEDRAPGSRPDRSEYRRPPVRQWSHTRHPWLVRIILLVIILAISLWDAGLWLWWLPAPWAELTYLSCRNDPANLPVPVGPDSRPANYLHTCGDRLYDTRGRQVRITGVNWFGMETGTFAPHGLWSRNWQSILDQIVQLGYNAIRLPFSNEFLEPGHRPNGINYDLNPDLAGLSGLQLLDKIIAGARARGLRVVLDRHRPTSQGQSDLWYTKAVPEARWIADWRMIAQHYLGNDTVIGVDLTNEPKGAATWGTNDPNTDWRLAAIRAGNAILEVNPYLLIFVQGVAQYGTDWYWWGGNLVGAERFPVDLEVANRVVYSPHDYGPGVFPQGWFSAPDFPNNLPGVWQSHWAYLTQRRLAPVVLGEFGGRSVGEDADGQWQRALVSYLGQKNIGFFTWSLNPNSGDTGGLLADDWMTVVADRQALYRPLLAPMIPEWDGPAPSLQTSNQPPQLRVLYQVTEKTPRTNTISFILRIQNDGHQPIDFSRLELRYWLSADDTRSSPMVYAIDWAAIGAQHVLGGFVPARRNGQDTYLRLTFDQGAGALQAYVSSGNIIVRLHHEDWSNFVQTNDYSFDPGAASFRQAPHITLYLDGKLVWGQEP